jgi:hypothetical protein
VSRSFSISDMPSLTTEQMVEVDRAMIEDYRIELIQMMAPSSAGPGKRLQQHSCCGARFDFNVNSCDRGDRSPALEQTQGQR